MDDKLDILVADAKERVREEVDIFGAYPEDHVSEIADGMVPIYNSELYEIAPYLNGVELSDPGLLPENPDILDHIRITIYDACSNAAHQTLYEMQEEWEEIESDWIDAEEEYEIVLEAREIVNRAADYWYLENWVATGLTTV